MTDKIKELRKIIPIPIGEALQLLKNNEGDVEKCVCLFKAKSIKEIQEITGCDEKMAMEFYEVEKYDFNRAVSAIREAIYDKNYAPIEGVMRENVSAVLQWLNIIEAKDFGVSLDFQLLDKALDAMLLIPTLKEIAAIVKSAKEAKDIIFEGYQDADPLEEFVRRHKRLDDNLAFQEANSIISLKVTVLKDEVLRHLRNL